MSDLAFYPGGDIDGGRLTLYAEPIPAMTYSLGVDFSLGIDSDSTDFDGVELLDSFGNQVAEAEGKWGGDLLLPILCNLIDYFEQPHESRVFIVGENTAHGLPTLRKLWERGHWIYFDRDERKKNRRQSDNLGHIPRHDDVTIAKTRAALAPHSDRGQLLDSSLKIRSARLLEQLEQYSFLLGGRKDPAEARDDDYTTGAAKGFHDDLVRAYCLSFAGLTWLPAYTPPPKPVNPHSFASVLRHSHVGRSHEDVCKSRLAANAKR